MTKDKIMNSILLVFYMAIVITMVVCHESWRDEAQSWLIARDFSPLEIIYQMKYEGHPFLYHYILMPFAKLGFPYITVNIISAIFCISSVVILLKKSPFNNFMKLLILLSTPFIYYAFLGRSYCLVVLLVILLSTYYKERENRPIFYGVLICLLANTHVIMLGLAIILFCTEFLYEIVFNYKKYPKDILKKHYIGAIIAALGILIMVIIAVIGSFNNSNVGNLETIGSVYENIISVIISMIHVINSLTNNIIFFIFMFFGILLFITIPIYEKKLKMILLFYGPIFFTFIVCALFYGLAEHTCQTVMLMILFAFWIYFNEITDYKVKKLLSCFFVVIFVCNIPLTLSIVKNDILYDFSSSKEVAEFINNNISEEAQFICMDDLRTPAIIPYLDRKIKFRCILTDEEFSITSLTYDRAQKVEKWHDNGFKNIEELIVKEEVPLYFIHSIGRFDEEVKILEEKGILKEIYRNENSIRDEKYSIVEVK